jgi:putative transcriptional regulator
MPRKLRNRMLYLTTEKERKLGRKITLTEIHEATGVSISVLSRWMRNQIERYDAPIVENLCEYFECEVGDLLYLEPVDGIAST